MLKIGALIILAMVNINSVLAQTYIKKAILETLILKSNDEAKTVELNKIYFDVLDTDSGAYDFKSMIKKFDEVYELETPESESILSKFIQNGVKEEEISSVINSIRSKITISEDVIIELTNVGKRLASAEFSGLMQDSAKQDRKKINHFEFTRVDKFIEELRKSENTSTKVVEKTVRIDKTYESYHKKMKNYVEFRKEALSKLETTANKYIDNHNDHEDKLEVNKKIVGLARAIKIIGSKQDKRSGQHAGGNNMESISSNWENRILDMIKNLITNRKDKDLNEQREYMEWNSGLIDELLSLLDDDKVFELIKDNLSDILKTSPKRDSAYFKYLETKSINFSFNFDFDKLNEPQKLMEIDYLAHTIDGEDRINKLSEEQKSSLRRTWTNLISKENNITNNVDYSEYVYELSYQLKDIGSKDIDKLLEDTYRQRYGIKSNKINSSPEFLDSKITENPSLHDDLSHSAYSNLLKLHNLRTKLWEGSEDYKFKFASNIAESSDLEILLEDKEYESIRQLIDKVYEHVTKKPSRELGIIEKLTSIKDSKFTIEELKKINDNDYLPAPETEKTTKFYQKQRKNKKNGNGNGNKESSEEISDEDLENNDIFNDEELIPGLSSSPSGQNDSNKYGQLDGSNNDPGSPSNQKNIPKFILHNFEKLELDEGVNLVKEVFGKLRTEDKIALENDKVYMNYVGKHEHIVGNEIHEYVFVKVKTSNNPCDD